MRKVLSISLASALACAAMVPLATASAAPDPKVQTDRTMEICMIPIEQLEQTLCETNPMHPFC